MDSNVPNPMSDGERQLLAASRNALAWAKSNYEQINIDRHELKWGTLGPDAKNPTYVEVSLDVLATEHIENILLTQQPPIGHKIVMLAILKERYREWPDAKSEANGYQTPNE